MATTPGRRRRRFGPAAKELGGDLVLSPRYLTTIWWGKGEAQEGGAGRRGACAGTAKSAREGDAREAMASAQR
jgi:hypothetical protein